MNGYCTPSVEELMAAWELALPGVQPPGVSRFLSWIRTYRDDLIRHAIQRTGMKARKMRGEALRFSAFDATRYCTATMRHETERRERWQERTEVRRATSS